MANEYSFLEPNGGFFPQAPVAGAGGTTLSASPGSATVLTRAAGTAVTLPPATGSGARFAYVCGVAISGGTTTFKVTGLTNDVMTGSAQLMANTGNTVSMWKPATVDDTMTWNGTTQGGLKGDSVEFVDAAPQTWLVRAVGSTTTTAVTPFSNTVTLREAEEEPAPAAKEKEDKPKPAARH
jgi:hypothetical protein